jgi:hypothetical protein
MAGRSPNRSRPLVGDPLPDVSPCAVASRPASCSCLVTQALGSGPSGRTWRSVLTAFWSTKLINIPLLTLFKWDGKFLLPTEIWERADVIREAVLGTIEDLAPKSNSYVFTNVLEDDAEGARQYGRLRSLAESRGSLFLPVMVDCDIDEQVRRIDTPDRIGRFKGSDPDGYRRYRRRTKLFQPPAEEVLRIDTTGLDARRNADTIYNALLERGLRRSNT